MIGLHRPISTVLNIWTFEFDICFGFRNSSFEFSKHQRVRTFFVPPLELMA
ncbi:hypothetical protein D1AOALGA4SA_9256 [Olavius algarvensis Delta 1 endosymbiont]|nr:hypothetical protein D1AOALGA4SA_9256 [Olavius algarvensis Delta 1 endosymbiont]